MSMAEKAFLGSLMKAEYLLKDTVIQLNRGHSVISFRDIKKEFERFPAIAGYFMRRSI